MKKIIVKIKEKKKVKEQFINGISDDEMITKVIKELTASMKSNVIISDKIQSWAKRVEAQSVKGNN